MKNKCTVNLLILTIVVSNACYAEAKQVIGWIEPVSLENSAITVMAKIDTGADGSSLNATNVNRFIKNGREWISFVLTNSNGKKYTISKPVHSYVNVKRKGTESQQRPVILLNICIKNIGKKMRVNLTDRADFKYQMLVGRRFLKDSFIVDSAVTNTTTPDCIY